MARNVTIEKASELTGYSEDAIRTKIRDGVWRVREVWIKAPDGRVLINMEGYDKWAESGSTKAFGLVRTAQSKSTSDTTVRGAKKGSKSSPRLQI